MDTTNSIPLKNTNSDYDSISMDEYFEPQKRRKFTCSYVWSYFTISGVEKVKRKRLSEEDFVLPVEVKPFRVAKYCPRRVAEYWNNMYLKQQLCTTMIKSFTRGLIQKLLPATVLYLIAYYTFSIFLSYEILCNQPANGTLSKSTPKPLAAPKEPGCNTKQIDELKSIEKDFSRVLTFFIGFFVSVSIRNYFQQVNLIPRFDTLTMGLDTFLWVDPTKKQDNAKVKGQYSAEDLRATILRYCFLSFTMCFSRFSPQVNRHFENAITYNNKKLLNKREFEELKRGTREGTDLWLDKWPMPLLWANKLVNDLGDIKGAKVKDIKEGITTTVRRFQMNLAAINNFSKYPMPPQITQILVLAIYFFLVVSAVSNQGSHEYSKSRGSFTITTLVLDFPLFTLMKYLMLFGWLKTAADLQHPFGSHRQHVDLIGFLDYEIWKVSHMLAQNIPDIPLAGPSESKGEESTTEKWEDFGPKWKTKEEE